MKTRNAFPFPEVGILRKGTRVQFPKGNVHRLCSQNVRVHVPGFSTSFLWQWNMYFSSLCLMGTIIVTHLIGLNDFINIRCWEHRHIVNAQ